MSDVLHPEMSNTKATAQWCEWLGWCGTISWLFLMTFGYDIFIVGNMGFDGGSIIESAFMFLFALSIAVFGWRFGRNPNGLAKIAYYTTPAAIVITAVLGILPRPFATVLYILAAVLMAPATTRRVYGVTQTVMPGKRITAYVSGWSLSMALFALWVIVNPQKEIAFLFPALLAVPAWIAIRRTVTVPDTLPAAKIISSKRHLLILAGAVVILFWLLVMGDMMLNNLFAGGELSTKAPAIMNTLMTWLPPVVGLTIFSIICDKGHDKITFIVGLGLFWISIMILLALDDTSSKNTLFMTLAFANVVGGAYIKFFTYTAQIYFFDNVKRPVFVASCGCILYLIYTGIFWQKAVILPGVFLELGAPLYLSAAITAIVFAVFGFILFDRYRANTLAASLYALLHTKAENADAEPGELPEPLKVTEALFSEREKEIALLLTEGLTQYDISRKLHIPSGEVGTYIKKLREKVVGIGDPDPLIAAIIYKYKLTVSETKTLKCLYTDMTAAEIAAELGIEEGSVRTYISRLLKKLPVSDRSSVSEWVKTFGESNE